MTLFEHLFLQFLATLRPHNPIIPTSASSASLTTEVVVPASGTTVPASDTTALLLLEAQRTFFEIQSKIVEEGFGPYNAKIAEQAAKITEQENTITGLREAICSKSPADVWEIINTDEDRTEYVASSPIEMIDLENGLAAHVSAIKCPAP